VQLSRVRARLLRVLSPVYWLELLYSGVLRLRLKKCGHRPRFKLSTVIRGYENIVLGNNFSSMGMLYLYADQGYLEVGDNCSVNTNVQLGASAGRIVIGDHVSIAANVVIRAANMGTGRGTLMRLQPHGRGEIIIEDDVWIGSNAVITAGVMLRKGTVVGAGAVVTKSTEPYSIVAGVPARKIGERI
jgi:acetyltransferase-like isoleucine patch superfamily enzyme